MPSLCKHHLDTAGAKRPKHHLDTSRKPPKPQAKKLFHGTFGIHINNLWSHRAHAQPMQTPSGHCRCKKTQTPSRHEPKTAQTASQKTVSRYLWNPHKTIFGATEHKPSLCKHKPMQTPSGHCRCKKTQTPSRHEPKTAQTASQKTVSRYLWNPHKTIFGATENMPSLCKHHLEPHKTTLEPQSTCPAYANTIWTLQMQKDPNTISKHHLDTSRKPPKPQAKKLFHVTFGIHIKQSLEPQSTCPAYANTIWTLQMQKDPNTI